MKSIFGASRRIDSQRLEKMLMVGIAVFALALGAVSVAFAYSYRSGQATSNISTPALRAIAGLKEVVRKAPNDDSARVRLGEALATAGLKKEAVVQLQAALKLNEKHTGAYLDLGLIAMDERDYPVAEKYFKKVTELTADQEYSAMNQRRETAFFNLGRIALEREQYEDAVAYLKEALRIRRDASDTYYALGKAFAGMDENESAVDNLNVALKFDPKYAAAHYLLGQIYQKQKDDVKAASEYAIAAEIVPEADQYAEALASMGTPESRMGEARSLLEDGDASGALDQALIARALDSRNAEVLKLQAKILEQMERPQDALKVWKEVLGVSSTDADAKAAVDRLDAGTPSSNGDKK